MHSPENQIPTAARRISLPKKVLYGLLTTALFFVAVEIVLVLVGVPPALAERDPFVGFEASIPLFVEQSGDPPVMKTAQNRLAYFNQQHFPKKKAEDCYRVFCVGGSTTYGRPYNDSTSFVAWLRELLAVADNSRRWEVINAGGISYASYRVAAVVDELCRYSPDLFVVYMGHNEFLEERTYRDFRNRSGALQPLSAVLQHTRVYALAQRLLPVGRSAQLPATILPAEVDAVLDHAAGPDAYRREPELRQQIIAHYEFNLRRIVDAARAAGAAVLLITPAANSKDFSPFKSEFFTDLDQERQAKWFELFLGARQLETQGNLEAAVQKLRAAAEIDSGRADLHYHMGQLLYQQGHFDEAKDCFRLAVELDVCPLRILPQIQTIIERVAVDTRVPLIDFDSVLQNDSLRRHGHQALGNEYFVDHVHPNIETHRLLALAIMEALIQKGVVTPNSLWRDQAVEQTSRKIEARLDPELQARALTNLAQVLHWAGKEAEAGPLAAQAVHLRNENGLPEDPESLFYLAIYLETEGASAQATTLYEKVLYHVPDSSQARKRLATLLFDQQRYEDALEQFTQLVEQAPGDAANHHLLGVVLLELEKYPQAVEALKRAAALEPDNAAIKADLELALEQSVRAAD